MSENRIVTDNYSVHVDKLNQTIVMKGTMRLENTAAYRPIVEMMEKLAETQPETLTINLRTLEFINSSGINSLSKFLMQTTKQAGVAVIVLASEAVPWQNRMLRSIQRVVPDFQLEFQ